MFGKIGPVLAIALLVAVVQPLRAQSADPTTVLEGGIQQHVEEVQRKRGEEQRESAYDREMCWRAGYRGPDIDQCVRSSAEYRRSQNFQWQPDYSG